MKKIFITAVSVFAVNFFAISQTSSQVTYVVFRELQFVGDKKFTPSGKVNIEEFKRKNVVGWDAFILVGFHWSEWLIGAAFRPKVKGLDVFNANLTVGLEADDSPLRGRANIFIKRVWLESLNVVEYGGSGFWYLDITQFEVSRHIKLGFQAERFVGVGPRFELFFNKRYEKVTSKGTPYNYSAQTSFWVMPAYNFETKCPAINFGVSTSSH